MTAVPAPVTDSDEAFFAQRGFGRPLGFGRVPVIISIDFINSFTEPDSPLGSDLDREIAAALDVLSVGRRHAVPIFHTTTSYEDPNLADAGLWRIKQAGASVLRAGSRRVEVDARIQRRPEEGLLVKKYASAFFGTNLVTRLTGLRSDTVILLGCTTSGCVRATAVDAVQLGFRPMVVREAVGDRDVAAHEQSLFDLQQKYADVVSLEETVAYLDAVGVSTQHGASTGRDRPVRR